MSSTAISIKHVPWSLSFVQFCEQENYALASINGQRIITLNVEKPNTKELFIRNLHKHSTLEDVFRHFNRAGLIYQIRLLVNYNEMNRGYCFCIFMDNQSTVNALCVLNDIFLMYKRLVINYSFDNHQLYVKGIPMNMSPENVIETLASKLSHYNVVKIVCPSNYGDILSNKGYCFIEFGSHKDAVLARKHTLFVNNQRLKSEWSYIESTKAEILNANILCIRGINKCEPKQNRFTYIKELLQDRKYMHIIKSGWCTYVYLHNREDGQYLINRARDLPYKGRLLDITWVSPRKHEEIMTKHRIHSNDPDLNNYKSLPRSLRYKLKQRFK